MKLQNYVLTVWLILLFASSSWTQPCAPFGLINTFPIEETFETTTTQWLDIGQLTWIRQQGPTPTPNTGPQAAAGGNFYKYLEGTNQTGSAVLLSPCLDMATLTNPELSLDYHMFGADVIALRGQILGLNGWEPLFNLIGNQGNQWQQLIVDLTAYRFVRETRIRIYAAVASSRGDESDIAIDNIRIGQAPTPCFTISVNSTDANCFGGSDGTATVNIQGTSSTVSVQWSTGATGTSVAGLVAGNYTVTATDGANCTVTESFQISEPPALGGELYITPASGAGQADGRIFLVPTGGTAPYQVLWLNGATGTTLFNQPAGYTEVRITDANNCQTTLLTYIPEALSCRRRFRNFPYTLNFEGGLGQFAQGSDDDLNWRRRSGTTPTNNTGPSAAFEGSRYRYLESSGNGNSFKTGALVTKNCLDISSMAAPRLSFAYHMSGATMGKLLVQCSSDGGITWRESIWSRSADQGTAWQMAEIDLTDFLSTDLRIRIVGITGNGDLSDIAIDDLSIYDNGVSNLQIIIPNPVANHAKATDSDIDSTVTKLRLYPNPAADWVTIYNPNSGKTIATIYDLNGRVVRQLNLGIGQQQIDVSALSPGMHIVRWQNEEGSVQSIKLIKQ